MMKKAKLILNLTAILCLAFTWELRAQLPNAWQINDNLTTFGVIEYVTNLTAGQVSSANANGWRYELVSRMVSDSGGTGAHSMAFGNGTRRFYVFFDLNASGQLTAQLLGDTTYTLTTAAGGTNYHVHELQYDPATSNATYRVDGVTIASWSGQVSVGQSNQVMWGANSSTGEGVMNYHSAKFEILGQGDVAAYGAGFDGNPVVAPSPTNQGWTRFISAGTLPEGPVSPDVLGVATRIATLAASPVAETSATLNASLDSGSGTTSYYFEYGTTTNYGAFTTTNTIAPSDASTNVTGTIGGLTFLTMYHFRAVAFNGVGMALGRDQIFTTRRLLPNAWQMNDNTTGSGLLQYQTNLTAAQVSAANSNGWHYELVSRMVSGGSSPSQSMAFGDGTKRFYIYFNLDGSGQLEAQLIGDTTYTVSDGADGTNYHTHELTYDPATGNATYQVDGVVIAMWPGQASTGQSNQVMWGANSTTGSGAMDYHSAEFDINGEGVIASYEAGFEGDPDVAPSPTNQGWTRFVNGTTLPDGPLSPDTVALPPLLTLPASDVTPITATLNAQLRPDDLDTASWFEYGTTTNYGNLSPTNVVPAGVVETNLSVGIIGLTPATTYHFRVMATNATGVLTGADQSFTTPAYVATLAATGLTLYDATLNASLNPGSLGLTYYWEYGPTTNYGSFTPTNTVPAGLTLTNVTAAISGLMPATTYHFRAIATDGFVTADGGDLSFTTPGYFAVGGGVEYSTAAWGDYDNDGRLDLLITGSTGSNNVSQLWWNTGSGFSNVTASLAPGLPGVSSGSVAWGDYDNDGRLDFLLTGYSSTGRVAQVWRNIGGEFSNVTASVAPGLPGVDFGSVAWGDYDNDGRMDFLLTGSSSTGRVAQVWRNKGNGFSNVTASVAPGLPGVSSSSVAWGDFDNDGRLDFLLTGDNGYPGVSQLWRNTGSGFSNVTGIVAPGLPAVYSGSVAWGDFDNDGRLDFVIAGSSGSTAVSQLWRNTGSGFTNVTAGIAPGLPGVYYSSVAWGDYDNDGRLDLMLAGTTNDIGPGAITQIWRNTGTGFTNLNLNLPGNNLGSAAFGDADDDGRLDLLLTGSDDTNFHSRVWVNLGTPANAPPTPPSNLVVLTNFPQTIVQWNAATDAETPADGLTYNLRVGTAPGASDVVGPQSDAFGLRRVPAMGNAQSGTNAILALTAGTYYWSVQAVDGAFAGSAFAPEGSFSVPSLPIGETLPATRVQLRSVVVNGRVNPNTLPTDYYFEYGLTTNYGNFTATNLLAAGVSTLAVSELIDGLNVSATYHFRVIAENATGVAIGEDQSFTTPHTVTSGLQQFYSGVGRWGDYDRDGRLDLAVVGLTNNSSTGFGTIWRNTAAGFTNVGPVLLPYAGDSVAWVDYDNDGDLDLEEANPYLNSAVTLWRNDVTNFTEVDTPIYGAFDSSQVVWGDFDNDGRQDMLYFSYDPSLTIQIWRNLGNAFTNIDVGLPLADPYSAAWGDFDGDGFLDLILTGTTSSSITQIWCNNGDGTFSNVTATVAPGLPRVRQGSVAWGDYDNDGRLDFLLSGTTNGSASGAIAQVWHNTGAGFTNLNAGLPGVFDGTVTWGDYDSDGRLDILLTGTTNGAASGGIAQIWRNTGTGFTNLNAGLPGVYNPDGSDTAAFGDYDNDGRLDILLVGTTVNGSPLCEVWINGEPATNTVPTAPTGLSAAITGAGLQFHWDSATDAQTPSAGLSYNLRVGTTPGGNDVVSPEAETNGFRLLPALGNAQMRTNTFLENLIPGMTYYWSVQAVDTAFAGGPFAPDASFVMPGPTLSIVASNANAIISWQPSYSGVILQESANLNAMGWTNSPSGATNPVIVPATNETRFYRLFKP